MYYDVSILVKSRHFSLSAFPHTEVRSEFTAAGNSTIDNRVSHPEEEESSLKSITHSIETGDKLWFKHRL